MKYIKYAIALLITGVCLYVAFSGVNLNQAWEIVTDGERIRLLPLAGFSAICLLVMWVRAWRWKYFYLKNHRATISGLTVANLVGFGSNNILPLRIGEVVRAIMARRKVDAPMSFVLATLFIERILDSISLLLCLVIPLAFTGDFPPSMMKIARVMLYLLAGAVILLIILGYKPHAAEKGVVKLTGWFLKGHAHQKIHSFMTTFTEGMKILRHMDVVFKVSALSVLHWGLIVFSYHWAFIGFGFDNLPWTAPFLTLGLVGLGVALPSAPAFIGPIHAAVIYALSSVYGLPNDDSAAFAVVMHLLMMAPVTVAGLTCLAREGLSLGQLRRRAEHLEEDAEPSAATVASD